MNLNSALYQTAQIRALEDLALKQDNLSPETLMLRAGKAAWKFLHRRWPHAKKIAIVCGKGNNGGDGLALAKFAAEQGCEVSCYLLSSFEQLNALPKQMARAAIHAGAVLQPLAPNLLMQADVIVDALLGIGITGPVQPEFAQAINAINTAGKPILALDIPSGLGADAGQILGVAVNATATITFIGKKLGLYTGLGPDYRGEVICDDLEIDPGIFAEVTSVAELLNYSELSKLLPPRSRVANKGNFGHVLVIGGDVGMIGAVRMAGEAALRVGAGLVTIATKSDNVASIVAARPELMVWPIQQTSELSPLINKATVIVLGPGLGQTDWSRAVFQTAMEATQPKVIDADGLNLLATQPKFADNWILTPHPGEAARLLISTGKEIEQDRLKNASEIQKRYGGVVVLKGAGTLIADGRTLPGLCNVGNPGMATGGMGDILSGVIGGLLAQKNSLPDAAKLGVMVHSIAGDMASRAGGERGLIATDLMPYLRRLVNPN